MSPRLKSNYLLSHYRTSYRYLNNKCAVRPESFVLVYVASDTIVYFISFSLIREFLNTNRKCLSIHSSYLFLYICHIKMMFTCILYKRFQSAYSFQFQQFALYLYDHLLTQNYSSLIKFKMLH